MSIICERPACGTTASVFRPTEAICKPHHIEDAATPHATDKDLFLNALGSLLASGIRSEFEDDDCGIAPAGDDADGISVCPWCLGDGCKSCGGTGRGDTHEPGCDCDGCAR